ncbi:uncharacterized protein F5891DRAFT_1196799 [Suillus fuscotomentosus]|uniref:Uncharacterized protein n=1 Tax=Suillus fuscotomentosus TaxID=1912939 RepID=A0AAD4DSL3_9AGAM|nr:uncharacterized protein F5891DRAFT_1196799 [Suillus fuscotomentosus]KAG1893168.1 hypothetical protein F5891DRAFT_1196799 [Suillus fuscotomentosus]
MSDLGLTSVSRAKCKFSALPNEGEWQSQKWSCAPSASVAAQQEGSAALTSIADILPHIIRSLTTTSEAGIHTAVSDHPPSSDLGCAINLLTQTKGLSMDDVMDLMDYLSSNPTEAVVFANFHGTEFRATWAWRKLSVICHGATSTTL